MSERWIPTREARRIENRIRQRSVDGYSRDHAGIVGSLALNLSGGGLLYYPPGTKLQDAVQEAREDGFDTSAVDEEEHG